MSNLSRFSIINHNFALAQFRFCDSMMALVRFVITVLLSLSGGDALPEEDGSRKHVPRRLGHERHFPSSRSVTHVDDEAGPPSSTELYFEQDMDHFGPSPGTYMQRYFVSDAHYGTGGGPMLFYLGNEADVTLYVNATGLMWENAEEFGALVVFAEHRYYGKSQLFPDNSLSNMSYLSSDQALMDYVTLIEYLREQYGMQESDAVIGFGGSYGGMLASWARFRYPHVWDGVIAASAPILAFEGLEDFFDPSFFADGLVYDVSTAGGVSSEFCEANIRKAFGEERALLNLNDPALVRSSFKLCDDDDTTDKDLGGNAMNWLNDALAYMSMGNFPYPSGYILNGDGLLPAFPVRAACEYLAEDLTGENQVEDWLMGLASFAGVYYNYTNELECNRISAPVNNASSIVDTLWDYQYCSQLFMVGGQGPDKYDIFWDTPWDGDDTANRCLEKYGFEPDRKHIAYSYGTPTDWATEVTNIVWSQGEYDPWRGGGVQESLSDSLIAFVIPKSAHHLDLFFSHQDDTEEVLAARRREVKEIRRWIEEKKELFRSADDVAKEVTDMK